MRIERRLAALLLLLLPGAAMAHHGSGISYDVTKTWSTWATVTEFSYKNPHPTMTFDRKLKDGTVEHWVAELASAPAALVRNGWTKKNSDEAMKPGTRVKLYLSTARAGGMSAFVRRLENEKGESIVAMRGGPDTDAPAGTVDLDGVPGGLQPVNPQAPGASPSTNH